MSNSVMIVEDSRTQREMLRAHLENAGYEVDSAASGEEALDKLTSVEPDIVISDIVMPGLDGYELCRHIKASEDLRHLPVVLLTSLNDPLDIVRGLEAGADNFLRKPYDPENLLSRIRSIIVQRELRGGGKLQMGIELFFLNRRFNITAERQQILDLLVSTFEDLVETNQSLRRREEELGRAHDELREQLRTIETERERLGTVLESVPEPLVIVGSDGVITEASGATGPVLGVGVDDLVGKSIYDVEFEDAQGNRVIADLDGLKQSLKSGEEIEFGADFNLYLVPPGGARRPVAVRIAPFLAGGGDVGIVVVVRDLGRLAYHDPVTKLPNHSLFASRVAAAFEDDNAKERALIVAKLDRFDTVRVQLGEAAGDEVLAEASSRMRKVVDSLPGAEAETFGYLGGADFAVLLHEVPTEVEAVRVANAVVERLNEPYEAGPSQLVLSSSAGLAFPVAGGDASELMRAAAVAASRASRGGGGVDVFDPTVQERAEEALEREAELRRAIDQGGLVVHFQPVLDVHTLAVEGVEALVRWEHPEDGLVPPGEFIPLAEESGLIVPLGNWVLGEACRHIAQWRESIPGAHELVVSVNVSARQLTDPSLPGAVEHALTSNSIDPGALELEITESAVMKDRERAGRALEQLTAMGVRIAIDDFGTGYSSLLYLRSFPADTLKIDRSFVSGMVDDAGDAAIVTGTLRLAHALGLSVIAEGVETDDQLVQLRMLGCDSAQGFLWSRPLPPDEMAAWLSERLLRRRSHTAEDQEALDYVNEQRDDVLAYLAHELRAPLTTLFGYAELLAETDAAKSSAISSYAQPILRSARELRLMLATLSDARSIQQGKIGLDLKPVDLAALTRAIVELRRPLLAPHAVTITGDDGAEATADETRIGQVLTNLLTNAAKFSPADRPIDVRVNTIEDRVEVAVRDYGGGVPEERRSELFRRFARLGSRQKGMGIGLHLSRAIVRGHGGDLSYEPAPDGGSIFKFTLPR